MLRVLGGKTNLPMLMEYFSKGLARQRQCGLQVLTLGLWDRWNLWDVCVVKKNTKLEGENTTFSWEKKTKPYLYFFFFFLEIVLFSCGVWTIKVNSIWCPSLVLWTLVLLCFVCFSCSCLIHWLMFRHLVWQSCSTWYICSFSPGLLKCFFISLWETYVYIIIWAEA
jgi:heme/copper-type cytochrome/quinol oxidase subunit 4